MRETIETNVIKWAKYPLIRPSIILAGGILLGNISGVSGKVTFFIFIFTLTFYGLNSLFLKGLSSTGKGALISLILFLGGIYLGNTAHTIYNISFFNTPHYFNVEIKEVKANYGIATIKTYGTSLDSQNWSNEKILIRLDNGMDCIKVGEQYLFKSRLDSLSPPKNPYEFDFKSFCQKQGVLYTVLLKESNFHLTFSSAENPFISKVQNYISNTIKTYIPDQKERGVIEAMVLGDKSTLNKNLKNSFTRSGAAHTLAVSGLHLGIVAAILVAILNLIKDRNTAVKVLKTMVLLSSIWSYSMITGMNPSVVRAAIMFTLFSIDFYWSQNNNSINFLGGAAIVMMLINPTIIYSISFQFSFSALLGILLCYNGIQKYIYRLLNYRFRFLASGIAVSIAAQLAVAPLSIYYFHTFPIYFIISSLWASAGAGLVISFGFLLIIFSLISHDLANPVAFALSKITLVLNEGIQFISSSPWSTIDNINWNGIVVLFIYATIGTYIAFIYHQKKILFRSSILFFAMVLCLLLYRNIRFLNQSQVTVYDQFKGTFLDIMEGTTCYALGVNDQEFPSYSVNNNRLKHGIEKLITVQNKERYKDGHFFYRQGIAIIQGNTIFIGNTFPRSFIGNVDYWIISRNTSFNVLNDPRPFSEAMVILSNDLSKRQRKIWAAALINHNIKNTLSILNTGGITIDIKSNSFKTQLLKS